MAKPYPLVFVSLLLLAFSSCQSLEQISIDYLHPADVSFPPQLKKVAVVNNAGNAPDNKLIVETKKTKGDVPDAKAIGYANGDTRIAAEALAEEIAAQNYFEEVVICDSALRANDKLPRENKLSQEEVNQLATDLGVDLIIALENLQFKATKNIHYLPDFNCYQGVVDMKVYPTIRVYTPQRSTPMNTLHPTDSIFWEEFGGSFAEATSHLIPETQMLREAAEFAGTVPVKYLVPTWKKGTRYLHTGGSVQMRDAAVYVRENSWDEAYELWRQAFESTKSEKKKMKTALNIAIYYEMKDSLAQAQEWAEKAQQLAKKIEKKNVEGNAQAGIEDVPNYYLTSLYLAELKERNAQLPKLRMQMSRFKDDF